MVVTTSIIIVLCVLFITIIFRHLKYKVDQKKELFESIYIAQEEERSRIAMDIHDDLGSLLIGLKLNLQELLHYDNELVVKSGIENALIEVSNAIKITRLTSQILMPDTLKNYGLDSAIKDLIKRYSAAILIDYQNEVDQVLPKFLEINIYRIISELFTNTIKHANATTIFLNISEEMQNLRIAFQDNGIGFDYFFMLNDSPGIGINNIKNRVTLLKGEIIYLNKNGSSFKINIPLY